jgi:hypothetical protein
MEKRPKKKEILFCHFSIWAHAENTENTPFPAPPCHDRTTLLLVYVLLVATLRQAKIRL